MKFRLIPIFALLLALATGASKSDKGKALRDPAKPSKEKKSDPSNALFATNAPILTFKIDVSGGEWAALQKDNRAYVRGSVSVGEQVFKDVGIRLKGNGSFRPLNEKPSLVVKFDRYVPDQTCFGETKIALNSSSQDGTYLADFIANGLFRDANVPVSRVTHARLILNGRALGIYVLVEMHNKEFLKRWFGNARGNLYEAYLADIDSQMDQDNGDDRSQNDRKKFAEVLKIPDPAERWAKLPQVLDVDRYLSHLVCEIFTSHTDGYAMNRNNYRIYHNPDTDRFTFIGHGVDWAFANGAVAITPAPNALVTKAVMTSGAGRKLFNERFGTLLTNAYRLEVLTNRVNASVARLVAHAQNTNEAKDFLRYGSEMNARLVNRWQFITNKLYGPPPIQLAFDRDGMARLNGWSRKTDKESQPALHKRGVEGSRHVLHISATNGPCFASWRTRVALQPGQYVFEGELRTAGIIAQTNKTEIGVGAGLRISGGKRTNDFVVGDAPWQRFQYAMTRGNDDPEEVELVCELRAMKGDVWFDEDSLRIVRKK
jgi:spore coat protein H